MANQSEQVHHLYYFSGDKPGRDVVPLCAECHELVHQPQHWIKDKRNPVEGNRQSEDMQKRLRLGFLLLSKGLKG